MERIYMDNAATTRVTEPVMEAMQPYFCEIFGNPMSVHSFGRESRKAVENARRQVAAALGAQPNEIYFTGCGTESDNWAVRGAAYANIKKQIFAAAYSDYEHYLTQVELPTQCACGATEDFKEGVCAFMEKRKANFQGK